VLAAMEFAEPQSDAAPTTGSGSAAASLEALIALTQELRVWAELFRRP